MYVYDGGLVLLFLRCCCMCAAQAGARANDVILAINNQPTQGQPQKQVIAMIKAAGAAPISWVLQAMPQSAPAAAPAAAPATAAGAAPRRLAIVKTADGYGFNLTRVQNLPAIKGVDAGGAAEKAGVRPGDIILQINGTSTVGISHKDTIGLVKATPPGAPLDFVVTSPPKAASLEAQMQQEMQRAAVMYVLVLLLFEATYNDLQY